ncbi:DNA cytosine methyltransferase [Parabacteroides sp. ZJ-118]|uniref:DNA cytosine methyltransferase n=1 Tax=Parabacteroides sp. ZJ-118 TaxID=2709398 RepID=UPI0013EB324C|nr:DNA cytosine methyltransferase [Parabacteroides sp. ZJ-118]
MTVNKFRVIDLFAGCGGLSLGLYQAGWNGVFAVEKNHCAYATLCHNLIEKKRHFEWPSWLPQKPLDILEVNRIYAKQLRSLRGTIDLVAGGPPCQGFSMAGRRVENDIRNQLVFAYTNFISMVMPKLLLFENVKGFTYAFDKKSPSSIPYSTIVIKELKELGYDVYPQVIDFSEFGIPQRRKRFILVGVLNGKEGTAEQFVAKLRQNRKRFFVENNLPEHPTIADAISDLLRSNGEVDTPDRKGFKSGIYGKISNEYQIYMRKEVQGTIPQSHSFAHHCKEKTRCFEKLLAYYPIRNRRIDGKEREQWGIHQRGLTVLDAHSIAPTITNMPDDYLHYQEPRIMTVRECARIQSFPDWYEFESKYTTGGQMRRKEVPRYSQVGNAIPPIFAFQAGIVLKEMLK